MSQADVIRYLGRDRMEIAREKAWLKPRTVFYKSKGKRGTENYAFADVLTVERKFLGEE